LKTLGHEVAISASFGLDGNYLNQNGVLILPGYGPSDQYGQSMSATNARLWKADIVVTLLDAWPFRGQPFVENKQRWVPLAPIDHEPAPPRVVRSLRESWQPAGFTHCGNELLRAEGLDPLYIPHAYDEGHYSPWNASKRADARKRLNIPADGFVVGVVAANKGTPSRKGFPIIAEAFRALLDKHSDAVLCLHTRMDTGHSGLNLYRLLEDFNIPETNVRFSDQMRQSQTEKHMAALFNSFDVLLNPANGEGFGVPILEAQACGVAPIVGDWTAMSEVAAPEAFRIPKSSAYRLWTVQDAFQYLAFPGDVFDALCSAYDDKGTLDAQRRSRAVAKHAKQWSFASVTPLWKIAFDRIAERIANEGELQAAEPAMTVEIER
jgi:glycosyltransferase involved in cell wall biosynthesis